MERAVDFLATHPVAGLPLQPGGRKTSITLAAFRRLLDAGKARSMLVIAPLRVARQTWPAEVAKWEQFRDMRVEVLHGPDKDAALKREAEIYLLNPEGVPWLSNKFFGRQLPFDVLCIDELTRFKNSQSQRSKLLRPHTQKTPYKWGLTGSLRPNTHMDLFGQQLMLDHGAALGRFITHFREKYFVKGFNGFSYDLRQGAEAEIAERLAGTWFYMDPKDYSQLPPLVEDIRRITLSSEARKVYDRMQSALVADLAGQQITAVNAGALYSKLAQMANGAVYSEGKASVIHLHDDKLDALDELLEELDGAPLLVAYEFNHDLARIQERFGKRMPGGVVPWLGKGTSKAQETEWIEAWNRNDLPMLCAHPACLHPDTLVLTEARGWVRLITVGAHERVFDGVEFVSHSGCQLSGIRPVIDKFGITMTPDHKVLVGGVWRQAQHVSDRSEDRAAARYTYTGNDPRLGALLPVWVGADNHGTEHAPRKSGGPGVPRLPRAGHAPHEWRAPLSNLARHGGPDDKPGLPGLGTLRRARDYARSALAYLQGVLGRHAGGLCRQPDAGSYSGECGLYEIQLPVGYRRGAASEQAYDALCLVSGSADAPRRVLPHDWCEPGGHSSLSAKAPDRGHRDSGLLEVEVPSRQEIPVFDLVDCGPRHRFAVKNADGEVFIVHNSAGHGLNLQEGNAQHVCYFSVTWDWELYDQFLRRVRRSGNEAQQIWNHILLVEGTIDEDKLEAQREKDAGQARLLQTLNKLILRDFAPNMETTMPNDKLPTAATWGAKPKGWGAAAPVEAEEAAPAPTRAAPKGWGAATPAAPDTTAQREKIAERISAPVEDAEVVEETAPLPEEVKSRFAALADQIKAASINPTGIEEPAEPVKAAPTRGRPRKTAEPVTQAPKAPEPVAEAVAGDVQDSGWQAPKAAAPSSFSRIDAMRMALSAVEDGKVSAAEVVKLAREIHAFVSEE